MGYWCLIEWWILVCGLDIVWDNVFLFSLVGFSVVGSVMNEDVVLG